MITLVNGCLNDLVQPGGVVLNYWHTNLIFQSISSEKMGEIFFKLFTQSDN